MRLATLLAALLVAAPAFAQVPGSCDPGTAQADLTISDVFARLFNAGNLFFGNDTVAGDGYFAPKATGQSPIFAAGIWVGGLIDGDLRVAGATYQNFEFWPGPLEEGATLPDPNDCSPYDRIWRVDVFDVQAYEETGVATADLAEWPVDLGAPVVDGDGVEGNYDLEAGDRPEIYGSQTAFWVMNDVGNEHVRNLTEPIGLEVRVTAFASVETDLAQQTVYRYELVNRNSEPFEAARFGLFVDPDVGDAADDYVGSDSSRSLAFAYNGDDTDAIYGTPPATGYDFLGGAEVSMYFENVTGPTSDPAVGTQTYNFLNGLWGDGTPVTEGGNGYETDGDVVTWVFPGDPVTEQFWSMEDIDGQGTDFSLGDRRNLLASPAFTLAPGESRTFDFAVLFAQGTGRLDSVSELRMVSDDVQARYDDDLLFVSGPQPPPSGSLPTPELLGPEDGAIFTDGVATLAWEDVTGAERYRVEVASEADFSDAEALYVQGQETSFTVNTPNEAIVYYWRVKAIGFGFSSSAYSDARSFTLYEYEFDFFGEGDGIVETAYPDADVCPDAGDPGCEEYDGNTVYLDPSATDDYFVASYSNGLDGLVDSDIVIDDDFELRFTAACAEAGACLGAYIRADGEIVSVPFELWNLRDAEDASDDVRMIPLIRPAGSEGPLDNWADAFPAMQSFVVDGEEVELGISDRVFFMMPDRPNGYELFEAAANGFGGPGAVYDPESDGDTQIDLNANGDECARQGWYVDFCYRDVPPYRAPVGGAGSAGLVVADLAGDGTTPPAGTTVRFVSADRLLGVDAEDDPSAAPERFTLEAAYPNPFRSSATVAYRLDAAADVRLAVYDVLGRQVRVLHEGPAVAGDHRAQFDGSGLASGVYLVVLEAAGQRQAQKVMLVR